MPRPCPLRFRSPSGRGAGGEGCLPSELRLPNSGFASRVCATGFASALCFRLPPFLHPSSLRARIRHRPCDAAPYPSQALRRSPAPCPPSPHTACAAYPHSSAHRGAARVSRVACDAPQSSPFTTSSSLPRSPLTLTAILRFSPGLNRAGGASPVSVTGPVTLPRIRHTPCDDPRPRDAPHRTRRVRRTLIFPRTAVLSTPVTEFLPLSYVACRAPNLSCCVSRVACDAPNQAPSPPAVHCPGRR